MGNKIVKYNYRGQEFIEESHSAAKRVFRDLSENELECFSCLLKHSPNGKKRYLANTRKKLYLSIIGNGTLINKAEEFTDGWFIPPNIGPKTLGIIFTLICKCSDLEYGKDLTAPEWS